MKKTFPLYYDGKKQPFAKAVVVGDLVFLSGTSGRTIETGDVSSPIMKDQMLVALDRIRNSLESLGTSMENIVKTTIYLRNLEDYWPMREFEHEYYMKYAPKLAEEPPASTFLQPKSLSMPQMLIEIDIIACIP